MNVGVRGSGDLARTRRRAQQNTGPSVLTGGRPARPTRQAVVLAYETGLVKPGDPPVTGGSAP
ncbi:hypothetical protein [Streptomyces sp. ME19-01-6]|uniref:hypothetical protein n=1 Tax=Streptomyces sp. ME19-01-6 TaxID=3028686 RepID=UPI0029BF5F9F|nr:hypothetical protein [Streptomyces sp. ME19-01-6]MDX3233873.1 hypothetical protein [Streptomyces sp. ME19-01-6]